MAFGPECSGENSSDGPILERSAGQVPEKGHPSLVGLVVLTVKQAAARCELLWQWVKTYDRGTKVRLLQNRTGTKKVPHPVKHHAFSIVLVRLSPGAILGFIGNRIGNRVELAERFDFGGIQVIEIAKQFLLLALAQLGKEIWHGPCTLPFLNPADRILVGSNTRWLFCRQSETQAKLLAGSP
jgi:hypothetical protein